MNFEQVRSVVGQKNDKGYQVSLEVLATLKGFKPAEYNKKGNKFQQIHLLDDKGEMATVKIWLGKNADFPDRLIGTRLSFSIAPNPYEGKMYYSGFWNSNAQVAPPYQQYAPAPQSQHTPPPQPAPKTFDQAVKQTYHPEPDRQDDIKFGQAANLAMQQCLIDKSVLMFEDYQQKYYKFLINRKMPMPTPAPQPEFDDEPVQEPEHNYTDSEIPF